MAIPPVSGNVNNGNFENAVKSDANTTKATTDGSKANAEMGGASKPSSGGNINLFDNDTTKKLPIGDDLFE